MIKLDPLASPFDASPSTTEALDPFDPVALRLTPESVENVDVKKLLTTVPVRKPHKHDFFRVHGDEKFRGPYAMIQLGDQKEFYLIDPKVIAELQGEFDIYEIYVAITRQGTVFLWPVRHPGNDGKTNEWWRSAHEAASLAITKWVRISPNMNLGACEIHVADGKMPDPEWPSEYKFGELLRIAFQNHHFVDRRLIDRRPQPIGRAPSSLSAVLEMVGRDRR